MKEFGQEFSLSNIQFFPMWLRANKFSTEVVELAHFESLLFAAANIPEGSLKQRQIQVNPSSQFIRLEKASSILGREPGLYAIWKSGAVNICKLDFLEAKIIDRLQEDLFFNESELMTDQEKKAYANLITCGLVSITSSPGF